MSQMLFVYGTLKRGHCREHLLAGQRLLGSTRTTNHYRLYNCGSYPGLVDAPGNGLAIQGELWEVDANCLRQLDLVEEIDAGLYSRRGIEVESLIEGSVQAYYYEGPITGLADCGDCW